jgi:hypothetical protein
MSNSQSNIKLFTQDDFKSADRIEKIYIWMMYPEKFMLSPRDEIYMDKLKQVYIIMTEEMMEERRIKKIRQFYPELRSHQILKLLDDSEELFGRFRKMNKEFQDKLVRERLMGMLTEMLEIPRDQRGKDYYKVRLDIERAILDLNNRIKEETQREQDLSIPTVYFGSDPKLLHTEDADYEEE